jgi:hypothetical protein
VAPAIFAVALDPVECGRLFQSVTLLEDVRKTRMARELYSPFKVSHTLACARTLRRQQGEIGENLQI